MRPGSEIPPCAAADMFIDFARLLGCLILCSSMGVFWQVDVEPYLCSVDSC